MMASTSRPTACDWLTGGGEMGECIRSTDWSDTPLGPRDHWPSTMRAMVNLVVNSRLPMTLLWGHELRLLYNDASREAIGERHPRTFGRPLKEVWPELWQADEAALTAVMVRGESVYLQDRLFPMERGGRRDDARFTVSYSPVLADDGSVLAILVIAVETTGMWHREQTLELERQRAELAAERERTQRAEEQVRLLREVDEQRKRLQAVLEAIPIPICITEDPEGREMHCNGPTYELYRLPQDTNASLLAPGAERRAHYRPMKDGKEIPLGELPPRVAASRGIEVRGYEFDLVFDDDISRRHLIANATPLRDARGDLRGSVTAFIDLTDQKRMEADLRKALARAEEGERTLQALMDSVPAGITIADAQAFTVRMVSKFARDIFGDLHDTPLEEVIRSWKVYRPDQTEMPQEEIPLVRAITQGETVRDAELVAVTGGRARINFLSNAAPIRDAEGRIVGAVEVWRDITERKQAELALQKAERQLREQTAWLEYAPVLVRDLDDRIVLWTPGDERLYGWTRAEAVGRTSHELLRPVFPQPLEEIRAELDRNGRWEGELRYRRKDGSEIIVASLWVRHTQDDGTCSAVVEVNTDITERRHAEKALRASQQLLRTTMDNFPTTIAFKDREGRFIDVNPAVEKALGLPKEKIIGRDFRDFFPAEAAARRARLDDEIMASRVVQQQDETSSLPTGTIYRVNTTFPLVDAVGNVYGTGHIVLDVTELRRAEQALREANEKLREADRRKDEFLAMLSHELRNPLGPIRNSVFILERAAPGGQQSKRALSVVERQVSHMARLTDDLLDMTRISCGKVQLRRERVDLGELVRRAGEDHRALFEQAGVALEVHAEVGPIYVDADSTRITQIVGNLLRNAAKFTPTGGHVTASLERDGSAAELRVQDDGIGIAPELLAKLFAPFVQADQALDRSRGGIGLGLALVKRLVELHGGAVRATSEGLGKGATFAVHLPLEKPVRPPSGASVLFDRPLVESR